MKEVPLCRLKPVTLRTNLLQKNSCVGTTNNRKNYQFLTVTSIFNQNSVNIVLVIDFSLCQKSDVTTLDIQNDLQKRTPHFRGQFVFRQIMGKIVTKVNCYYQQTVAQ